MFAYFPRWTFHLGFYDCLSEKKPSLVFGTRYSPAFNIVRPDVEIFFRSLLFTLNIFKRKSCVSYLGWAEKSCLRPVFCAFRVDSKRKWMSPSPRYRADPIDIQQKFIYWFLIIHFDFEKETKCPSTLPTFLPFTYLWSSVKTFQSGRVNFEVWLTRL